MVGLRFISFLAEANAAIKGHKVIIGILPVPVFLDGPLNLTHWTFKTYNCSKGSSEFPLSRHILSGDDWKSDGCDATLACMRSTFSNRSAWIKQMVFFIVPVTHFLFLSALLLVVPARDISWSQCIAIAPGRAWQETELSSKYTRPPPRRSGDRRRDQGGEKRASGNPNFNFSNSSELPVAPRLWSSSNNVLWCLE